MEKQLRNKMLIGFFVVGLLIALIVLATPLFLSDINKVYAADSYTVTFQDDDGTILKEVRCFMVKLLCLQKTLQK